jgi:hypothetical protein
MGFCRGCNVLITILLDLGTLVLVVAYNEVVMDFDVCGLDFHITKISIENMAGPSRTYWLYEKFKG